jgi:hypothetical protein
MDDSGIIELNKPNWRMMLAHESCPFLWNGIWVILYLTLVFNGENLVCSGDLQEWLNLLYILHIAHFTLSLISVGLAAVLDFEKAKVFKSWLMLLLVLYGIYVTIDGFVQFYGVEG